MRGSTSHGAVCVIERPSPTVLRTVWHPGTLFASVVLPWQSVDHEQADSMSSPKSLQGQRQTSMEHGELQRIALIMIVYGELLLYESQTSVDLLTYGFIGSLALADEQPRECARGCS